MSLIFTRAIRRGSTLVDADTTPTLGIVRVDTGATIIAAGTPMVRTSVGRYAYTLASSQVVAGVTYRATYQLVMNGRQISTSSEQIAGKAEVTAAAMVTRIKEALASSPGAVVSVSVDGQTVQWNRAQAIEELKFWQREAAKEGNKRPRSMAIYLGGF